MTTMHAVSGRRCPFVRFVLAGSFVVLMMASSTPRADGQTIYDDQVIYGWQTFTGNTDGIETSYTVTTYTNWGRRYQVVVKQGATHATKITLSLDGRQWIGEGEFTSSTDSLTRTIDVTHTTQGQSQSHTLKVKVWGTSSSVSVRIYHVAEPTFPVYGWHTFNRLSTPADETEYFLNSYYAGTPYLLRVINGDSTGSHRATNATVHLNGDQILWASDFGTGIATITREVLLIGPQVYNWEWNQWETDIFDVVTGRNESSASGDFFKVQIRGTDTTAPTLSVTSPPEGLVTKESSVAVVGTSQDDETKVLVTVSDSTTAVANTPVPAIPSFSDAFSLPFDGWYTIKVKARNSAGFLADSVYRHVRRDTKKPAMTVNRPGASFDPVDSASIAVSVSWSDSTVTYISVDGDTVASGLSGTYMKPDYPLDLGPNRIVFRAQDKAGNDSTIVRLVFRNSVGTDSLATLSPSSISLTEIPTFLDQVRFIYTSGSQPLQRVSDTLTFQPTLAAVVRGKVMARDFGALKNVMVKVLGHDEYGYTFTRADGQFDLVVNGGSRLVLRFLKDRYLEAQREVDIPINDYTVLDSIAMIGRSERWFYADTASATTIIGRFESDSSGDRRMYVFVPRGALATITPNGAAPISGIWKYRIRLKEFTVGSGGPATMPSGLPATTAYTYCVDMSLVEADSIASAAGLGALPAAVAFSKPIVTYVKDFLSLPVGTAMPSGYYDRSMGRWVAEENGRIIKVLSTSGGVASLDIDGNGVADTLAQYVAAGIDSLELTRMATVFKDGETLWRDPISHFSTHDFNLNAGTNAGLGSSSAANAGIGTPLIGDPERTCACVIENENRVLGETIPIKGTPYTLSYRSSRQFGDKAGRWIRIPLTGSAIPAGLRRVHLQVDVAGKRYTTLYTGITTNDVRIFSAWDGQDAYGRKVPGSVTATVRLGYEFQQSMSLTPLGSNSYGNASSVPSANGRVTTGDRDVGLFEWITQKVSVGAPSMASAGLGGWTLSPHSFYDTNGRGALYLGDGSVRYGYQQYPIIKRFAGTGTYASAGPDTTAFRTTVPISPGDLAFGPDGSLFFIGAIGTGTGAHHLVFRIRPNGTIIPWAGCLSCSEDIDTNDPQDGDFAVSTTKRLVAPNGLAVGRDGSVYISDGGWRQVYKITPDDTLHVIAGKYSLGYGSFAEGALAKPHALRSPSAVGVGPDGSVYIADAGYRRVVRVGTDGIMHGFAGDSCCVSASAGKADSIMLNSNLNVSGIAISSQGMVYLADGTTVWLVTPDGQARSISGPDHGAGKLALGPGGELYIGTGAGYSGVVRRETDGTLSTIAGTYPDVIGGSFVPANFADEEGGFAKAARLEGMGGVAIGPDRNVYVSQVGVGGGASSGYGIRFIATQLPGQSNSEIAYPSADGRHVHYFTLTGQHLRTVDGTTGVTLVAFDYDGAGRLIRVRDANGDTTTIQRSGGGSPLAIVGPYGQRTKLTLDGAGYLAEASDSLAGESYQLDYANDGLLQHFTNPRGKQQTFSYNSDDGRLHYDEDAANAIQALDPTDAGLTQTVTRTTEEGRVTRYQVTRMLDGLRRRLIDHPSHGWSYRADSMNTATSPYGDVIREVGPGGEVTLTYPARDKRFGMLAQTPATVYTILPSGLRRTMSASRDTALSGVITETKGLNGNTYTTTFTQSTRSFLTTSPEGRTTSATLDAGGRPVSVGVGSSVTPLSISYDGRGRVEVLTQGGRGLRYGYDASGRLQVLRDTLGRMVSYNYDNADRLTAVLLPDSRSVGCDHDENGNLTSVTPPGGNVHTFNYSNVDLVDTYTPPSVSGIADPATRFTYNADRQLTRVSRPDGRLISAHFVSSSGLLDSLTQERGRNRFTYSSSGQRLTADSPDSVTLTYGYDGPLIRAEAWTGLVAGGAADSVSVRLNIAFKDSIQTINGSSPATYAYDHDGLLTSATVNGSTETISRRSDDGLISGTSVDSVTSTRSYNSHGELWKISYAWSGGGSFQETVDRDSLGRVVKVTESGIASHVYDYHYDAASRLDSIAVDGSQVGGYTYNPNGNRVAFRGATSADTATATYDAQDRMLRYGSAQLAYSASGNLVRKIGIAADTSRYTYDTFGNLTGAYRSSGDSVVYLIDGENRRVARVTNGARTSIWLYENHLRVAAELDSTGTIISRYVYGTEAHVPDLVVRGGTTYRLIIDHLGSVRAVVATLSGTLIQEISYDAWGVRTTDTGRGIQALGYAGGLTDSATGLIHFGARDYDPASGRWCQRDPRAVTVDNTAVYQYASADPLGSIDPDGMSLLGDANDWFWDVIKHRSVVGGGSVTGTPTAWLGDLPGHKGTAGRGSPPGGPWPPHYLDVDAICVCGQWYHIHSHVWIVNCSVIGLADPIGPGDPEYERWKGTWPVLFEECEGGCD